jgi:predicted nucleic acid-binding Zn ribbon protein
MTRPVISDRACPDCGSPARGNPCWYFLDRPEWATSGADPPCSDYDYARDAMARERRFGRRCFWIFWMSVVALIALIVHARAQEHHAQHHAYYQNWVNQADKGCCNNQDCGELADQNERATAAGTVEVKIDGEWYPVLPHHYLKRGNAPDWSTSHVCVQKLYSDSPSVPTCLRLLCYQPKPGT